MRRPTHRSGTRSSSPRARPRRSSHNDPAPGSVVVDVDYDEFAASRLPALLRFAVMLTGDPDTAADVVQDAMVKAHVSWRRVLASEQPDRYVRRMITNAYIDQRRGS